MSRRTGHYKLLPQKPYRILLTQFFALSDKDLQVEEIQLNYLEWQLTVV
ncbi:MAG: hypothetical protein V7L14_28545 [Nostoc sp.]|nr:hypothetical protein [Nostoc sp. NOS(2021)]MBN3893885.1 hypothetical protein [Nostoc sp. NOS(2021)]